MSESTFDLDALEAEARGAEFPFTLGGERFVLPAASDADWRAVAAIDSGQLRHGFRLLMGDEQFARFETKPLSAGKLGKLVEAYLTHQGMTPGEPPASTDS